ncbi:MAG: 6-bladed beta-propeller [Ignavibacteriae bacterium]|nr:6-bladed beta-propeller [Ignavibacteriota bacterium]
MFLTFLLLGCKDEINIDSYQSVLKENIELIKIDSILIKDSTNFNVGSIKDGVIWQDKLLIADNINNCIWVFEGNKLIKKIGRKGRGPEEFASGPYIVNDKRNIYLPDYSGKKIEIYNDKFAHAKTVMFPKNVIIQPGDWICVGDKFVLWGVKPSGGNKISEMESTLILSKDFEFVDNIIPWPDYLKSRSTHAVYTRNLKLSIGIGESFFLMQGTQFNDIMHLNNKNKIIKKFGRYPKYYKTPPDVPLQSVMKSLQATAAYVAQITKIYKLDYDTKDNYLLCNYVNYYEEANFLRTALLGDHYLQIYNNEYDVIFDEPIEGNLLSVHQGKIYILVSDEPDNVLIKIFKIENIK